MEEFGYQKCQDDIKFAPKFIDSTFNNNLGRVSKIQILRKNLFRTVAACILTTTKRQNYN